MTGSDEAWEAPRRPPRRRAVAVAGGLALATVLAALVAGVPAGGDAGEDTHGALEVVDAGSAPPTEPPTVPSPSVAPTLAPTPPPPPGPPDRARTVRVKDREPVGSWREIAAGPLSGRTYPLAAWTGSEVLVWGGLDAEGQPLATGAAYDPGEDRWRAIAEAPRPAALPDGPPVAVWTGSEMLVLGTEPPMAYRPGTDTWRDVAAPPDGDWVWASAGWVGGRVVVLADSASGDGEPQAVAYDPGRDGSYDRGQDAWEQVPPPPVHGWEGSVSTVLGARLVVTGLADDGGSGQPAVAVYDPAERGWEAPQLAPVGQRWYPRLVADESRQEVFALGGASREPGLLLTWSADRGWRDSVHLPAWLVRGDAVATGAGLLVYDGTPGNGALVHQGHDVWVWQLVAEAPLRGREGHVAVWTGDELVVWGGGSGGLLHDDGAAFAPGTNGWRYAEPPPGVERLDGRWRRLASPGFTRDNPSLDWTGERLLLWGGAEGRHAASGSAYDPAGDAWAPIVDARTGAPVAGRQNHVTAWTGTELLVWGGHDYEGLRDGAAYDPAARRWRALPEAPFEGSQLAVGAWTGERWLVVAGGAEPRAAAYDPAADRWSPLPDPPPHGHRHGAVWTGSEMVVLSDAVDGTVIRLDPSDGIWRGGADNTDPRPSHGAEVAWTGEEVLLWGGASDEASPAGWAYHPGHDTWRRLPDAWLDGTINAAGSVWTGEHWVVLGSGEDYQVGLAAYDPAADRWLALPEPYARMLATGPLAWTGSEVVVWSMFGEAIAFRPGG